MNTVYMIFNIMERATITHRSSNFAKFTWKPICTRNTLETASNEGNIYLLVYFPECAPPDRDGGFNLTLVTFLEVSARLGCRHCLINVRGKTTQFCQVITLFCRPGGERQTAGAARKLVSM